MDKYIVAEENLDKFIGKLITDSTVYAPVEENDITLFKKVTKPADIHLSFTNTKVPPKNLLFKQTETLFKFTPGTKGDIQSVEIDNGTSVIFGIRPCDAKGFEILDCAFKGDFEDPYYLTKREKSVLVGLSCIKPCNNCFCTSLDDSPANSKSMDILLTDIGKKYLIEVETDKGKNLIKKMGSFVKDATAEDEKKKKDVEQKAIDAISRQLKTKGIVEKLDTIFDNPFWKEITDRCLGCGTCTYLCPTCHCFDIQDESTLSEGARIRIWDACMIPEYTLQASGYNPRPMRMNRMRNRVFHKYNYFPKNFDVFGCVGCGRCIDGCPVNIDIIDTVTCAGEVKA